MAPANTAPPARVGVSPCNRYQQTLPTAAARTYRGRREHQGRRARVPHHPPGEGHARAGRPARPSATSAASPDCAARRSPCSPASAPTTTPAWSAATSPASPSRSSTPSPGRCGSMRPNGPTSSTSPGAAAGPVRGSRRTAVSKVRPGVLRILDSIDGAGVRAQRPHGHPRRQRPCRRPVRRHPRPHRLPLNLARFLFLDHRAPDFFLDWDTVADDAVAALRIRGRPQPVRQAPHRPGRRAGHQQRGVPRPVGAPQRQAPPHRHQEAPQLPRRRPRAHRRSHGTCRRRTGDHHLHRRARQPSRGGAEVPGQLGEREGRGPSRTH